MTDLVARLRNVQTFIGVAELRIEAADENTPSGTRVNISELLRIYAAVQAQIGPNMGEAEVDKIIYAAARKESKTNGSL